MLLHVFRGDEDSAFWGLVVIVEVVLPGTFGRDMFGLHVQQRLLGSLLEARRPKLAAQLASIGLTMPFVSTQWFVSLFINSVPRGAVPR